GTVNPERQKQNVREGDTTMKSRTMAALRQAQQLGHRALHAWHPAFLLGMALTFAAQASTAAGQSPVDPSTPNPAGENLQTPLADVPDDDGLPAVLARVHPAWRGFAPTWTEAPCPFPASEEYDFERVDCGYVLVPENRRNPDSRLIRLSIARVHSEEEQPAAGTTVFLNGGPGNPIVRAAPRWSRMEMPFTRELLQISDLILLDQRGTGYSQGFFCRGFDTVQADAPDPMSESVIPDLISAYRLCLDEGAQRGVDISAYTTWDNAMDVRDLRRALGLTEWNVFGGSYGTELGQMVLRIDPSGVRSAVLDSVVAPPPLAWGGRSFGMRSALEAINTACVEHGACAEHYGDLTELAERAVERYREEPLVLEDIPLDVSSSGRMVLNHRVIASGFFSALYNRQLYPAVPALMEAVADRNEVALRSTAILLTNPPSLEWGSGMGVVAACTGFGPVSPERRNELRADEPFWFEAFAARSGYLDACEGLGLFEPDPLHTFLESDRPVLLAVGAVDPITPPAYAEYVLTGLENGVLMEVPYTGHFATAPECATSVMAAFLRSPLETPDQSCIGEMAGIDFATRYKPTDAVYQLYQAIDEGRYTGLIAPVLAMLVLLAAVLAYPTAWLGRTLDGQASEHAAQRRLAWIASVLLLSGAAALVLSVFQTFSRSFALLPLGLVGPTAWVMPLLVLGLLLSLLSMIQVVRKPGDVGTLTGVGLVLAAGIALSVSLLLLGLLL
ncbi:MAG: alpha/beta fold hydrolase, partial [Pseudomonadota bacterium]